MRDTTQHNPDSLEENTGEDTKFLKQETRYFEALKAGPKTMKMAAEEIGVDRANLCWFTRKFKKAGLVEKVKDGRCMITHHTAGFLTTDPELFPAERQNVQQLKLF
jgi:predicted transcriptional regulator